MKGFTAFFLLSVLCQGAMAEEKPSLPGGQCLVCHEASEDEPSILWKDDVHAKAGIGCEKCHGGDPNVEDMDQAKAKKTGFRGAPKAIDIPKLCASCH